MVSGSLTVAAEEELDIFLRGRIQYAIYLPLPITATLLLLFHLLLLTHSVQPECLLTPALKSGIKDAFPSRVFAIHSHIRLHPAVSLVPPLLVASGRPQQSPGLTSITVQPWCHRRSGRWRSS